MRIGHNIPALSSYNASSHTNALPGRSVSRLSTGLRISSADGDGSSDEKVTEMKTASRGSVLSDITAFYDENGRFLLEDPQQPCVQRVHQRCPQ